MSITDELREVIPQIDFATNRDRLRAIADLIDMKHELGRGTCEMEYVRDWMGWHCKSCDNLRQGLPDQKPNYCPNCGRRVVAGDA